MHLCGFSPLWMSRCLFKSPLWTNDLSHCVHLRGFSPEWMRECCFKVSSLLNDLSHFVHLCVFSLVWMRMCLSNSLLLPNDLLQCLQLYFLIPLWIFLWWERLLLLANVFGHKAQDICFDISYDHQQLSRLVINLNWIGFTRGYRVSTALRITTSSVLWFIRTDTKMKVTKHFPFHQNS